MIEETGSMVVYMASITRGAVIMSSVADDLATEALVAIRAKYPYMDYSARVLTESHDGVVVEPYYALCATDAYGDIVAAGNVSRGVWLALRSMGY